MHMCCCGAKVEGPADAVLYAGGGTDPVETSLGGPEGDF